MCFVEIITTRDFGAQLNVVTKIRKSIYTDSSEINFFGHENSIRTDLNLRPRRHIVTHFTDYWELEVKEEIFLLGLLTVEFHNTNINLLYYTDIFFFCPSIFQKWILLTVMITIKEGPRIFQK